MLAKAIYLLIIILLIGLVFGIILQISVRKEGKHYYRNGLILVSVACVIVGFIIPYYQGGSIKVSLVFSLLGFIGGPIFWSSVYKAVKGTVGFREKLWGRYTEKHPWLYKNIYPPDDPRYYGTAENRSDSGEKDTNKSLLQDNKNNQTNPS